jgi:uncharacterized protein YbjT (DUF2867 family)
VKAIIFGATGMVGHGVLRVCLLAPDVERVLAVGRRSMGQRHEKLRELVTRDLFDLGRHAAELTGFDACFFCLGVSSAGMSEPEYRRVTKDLTLAAGEVLARLNPSMTFEYVSGAGTDSTERGQVMWARVKGETENALLRLPFKGAYMFRPGYIQPLHGARSRTRSYRLLYAVLGPLYPVWRALFPRWVTTTELVGKAMLAVARNGGPRPVLETPDINALAGA